MYNLLIDIRANIANLQRDMDQAQGVLKKATSGFGSVMRGFFEGFGQELAKGVSREILNISKAIGNLAGEGDKLGAIADNFKALGGSSGAIKKAQEAVLGTVNAFDLMQAANEGMLRGIPNLNEKFADLAKYANQFADATGQDTVPVLNQLIEAIGSGKAEALKKFGFELGEAGSKAENSALAFEQLTTRIAEMGELGESVTQGQEAFAAAIEEARGQIAIAINDNQDLARVYNDLANEIKKIDWVSVGNDVASMISTIASALPNLQSVADKISQIAQVIRLATGNGTTKDIYNNYGGKLQQEITALEGQIKVLELQGSRGINSPAARWLDSKLNTNIAGDTNKEIQSLREAIKQKQNDLKVAIDLIEKDQLMASNPGAPFPLNKPLGWNDNKAQRNAINFEKRLGEEKEKGASKAADNEGKERLKALEEYNDEQMRLNAQAIDAEFQARKAQSESWVATFEDLFSGSILGLSPIFAQIAAGFADDIGEALGGLFGSGGGSGNGGGLLDFLGSNLSTADAHGAGIQGPGLENGSFGGSTGSGGATLAAIQQGAQVAFQIFQSLRGAREIDAENNNASGTGAALGQIVLGGQFGAEIGKAIGGMFGRGPQNRETQSRHSFANYMEDRLREMGGLTVRDGNGGSSRLTNFMEGSSGRFNDGKWADTLNSQTKEVSRTFSGLGEAFKEILGITEDVGAQIGFLLGENLKFNIDNARMLVKRLGLSFEEIEKQLVETGLKGERTWLEIESDIQGVAEAFKPGLAAVGAFGQAMDNLLGSGARGFEAVQSIRDIAVEAAEAGIKNFEQLRVELLKTFDPATVDAFFKALQQRGVTSIGELMQLSDRTAGGIVADMQALGVKFTDTGKKIGDSISSNTASTDANTRALNANTKAQGGKAPSDPVDELETDVTMAKGGILTGPTRALMGEAGPEAVLPLTRKNGKLGVAMFGNIAANGHGGGGYSIHIDARGAAPGVEKSIRSALRNSERRVLDSISRSASRSRRTT
jgi:hypothetical protein